MADFTELLAKYAGESNKLIDGFTQSLDCKPQLLADSIKYSLNIGGKRIRPSMALAAADLLNVERPRINNFALAIELIHTYSLIHDDLPEMDNDDFRRGQPSNHKVFGAGNAVLAGDALLNTAYSILFSECSKGADCIAAAEFICNCAGIYGMIAGQSADLAHENDTVCTEDVLGFIYLNKTAKMLTAPLVVPALLAGGKYFTQMNLLGTNIGYLFQLTDDILDVEGEFVDLGKSVGKDKKEGKCTAVSLFGLDGAKLRADILVDKCLTILDGLNGDISFFEGLINFIRSRKY